MRVKYILFNQLLFMYETEESKKEEEEQVP